MNTVQAAYAFCLLAVSLNDAATAQTNALREDQSSDIVVTATGQSSATSSTKTDTPIIASPQSISIVNREELDLRASPTIADALSYTAGVYIEPYGADNRTDEVVVRGFGAGGFSSNNNFVDGLRLPSGGQWTRPGFDPFALQQLEVLKGPSGALYGQTAPGGVVNLVSKRPTFTPHGEVLLQSLGYNDLSRWSYQGAADYGGPITSTLAGRIVGLARYGETSVRDTENARQYLSAALTWQPTERTTWTLLGQYQRDEGNSTFQFLPALGVLTPTGGRFVRNDDNLGERDWNDFDRNQYLAASFFEHRVGDRFAIRNNSRYTRLETLYEGVLLSGGTLAACPATIRGCIPGRTVQRRGVKGVGDSDGFATDTQFELKLGTGSIAHTLLAGVDYFHTEWQHGRDAVAAARVLPLLDILGPIQRGASGYDIGLIRAVYIDTVSRQRGLYAQDQIAAGRMRVTVGVRQDESRDTTVNFTNPAAPTRFRNEADAFTWRAGGVYLFDNGLAPYVSYSESFQPQVSDPSTSLNAAPFVPVTGQQYEAGLRFQRGRGIYVTLGGYQIRQQNITTPDPAGTLCGLAVCLVQTGEGRVRGIELEGKASLPWGTAIILTGTRSDAEITKSNATLLVNGVRRSQVGLDLPQVPEWLASAFLDQRFQNGPLAGFGLGGGVRYTGRSWGDTNNTLRIPDYTLFDVFVRYDFGVANPALKGLLLSVNGRNVGDERFVATCNSTAACYYGQGRSLTARLQFRW